MAQKLDITTFKQRVYANAPKACMICDSAARVLGINKLTTVPVLTDVLHGFRAEADRGKTTISDKRARSELSCTIQRLCFPRCMTKQTLEIALERFVIEFLVGSQQQTAVETRVASPVASVRSPISAYSLRFPSKAAELAKLLGSPEIRILRDIEDSKGDLKGIMAWEFMALCRVLDVFDRNKLISPALDPSFYRQDPASAKTTAVQEFDKSKTIRDLLVLAHAFESRSETPEATSAMIKSVKEAVFLLGRADRIQNPNKFSITDQLSAVTELIEFVNKAETPLLERLEGIARACGGLKMLCAGEQFLHLEFSRRAALDKT